MSCADSLAPSSARRRVASAGGIALASLLGFRLLHAAEATVPDLGDIRVQPVAGQNAEQARRDRYDCHNWAVQQTGRVPTSKAVNAELASERRGERAGKVVSGAAIGAAIGGIVAGVHDYRDAGDGMLAGGVLGAIGGAAAGARAKKADEQRSREAFDEYFRALDACMTARGYTLSVAASA